jgi:hypothetical protein
MLGVRRTAGCDEAKGMPTLNPLNHALQTATRASDRGSRTV